jgi:predicted RecB family nuclease
MREFQGRLLFSAHDLVNFLACPHVTFLDLRNLEHPLKATEDDAQSLLLKKRGLEHERRYLYQLHRLGRSIEAIPADAPLPERVKLTRDAMAAGADIIYQAVLLSGPYHGFAAFLRRLDSRPGSNPAYEVLDTKLARSPAPHHLIELCFYSHLLGIVQGSVPHSMHLVLGDNREAGFRFKDFAYYFRVARKRFESFVARPPADSYPQPCRHCERCSWRALCCERWEADDHLSAVADMQRSQIRKLNAAGIMTVHALAALPENTRVPKLSPQTLARLRSQARLQVHKRETGSNRYEFLPLQEAKGFARLPKPDPGDMFLDFEGDPLYPDGLEYLMGIHCSQSGKPVYQALWAHDHGQERVAFEQLIDFISIHLHAHPQAHLYHFSTYEDRAIKRLAAGYATRESVVDDLLRNNRLVDLCKVVREAVRVSEPHYSLKALETFYMPGREGTVEAAPQSIVCYEQWRQSGDEAMLRQIEEYNAADCRSARLLRDWLVKLRPKSIPWFDLPTRQPDEERVKARLDAEVLQEDYAHRLLLGCAPEVRPMRQLVAHLLEFHRREAKPQWWAMFERRDYSEEELIDDVECLGGLRLDKSVAPFADALSTVVTYRFPPQDCKLEAGDSCLVSNTLEPAGTICRLDGESGIVQIKRRASRGPLPEALSVIPSGPIENTVLHRAMYRLADALIKRQGRYRAVQSFLMREPPSIQGIVPGAAIIANPQEMLAEATRAVASLRESCLFIQGPPGSGKTWTSAQIIVDLMKARKKVGVTSNSHKAINNLLRAVEERVLERGLRFRGVKKSDEQRPDTFYEGRFIRNITDNRDLDLSADLLAGTAWLFAREELDRKLDFLFVDEAGQVSLANLAAMGLSARNIVLVGDQMQLAQPSQGVHPGDSGLSALDYLLDEAATIPPGRGIFLPTTYRMHEKVCRFISEILYEGRLRPEPENQKQELILGEEAHPALMKAGIRFVPVEHDGCAQKSDEEAEVIRKLYVSLLEQQFQDKTGKIRPVEAGNVLVVSPYNLQVKHLKSVLPSGARVGTVDKFQGQEAEVVLISMTTSSVEDLPRNIEFLYSKNRLNVAISRARCLSIIVASPRLLEIPCETAEQMQLVNTLCCASAWTLD